MKEDFLHYIWKYHIRTNVIYKTTDNIPFKILEKGTRNTNAGPDILYSRIILDKQEWAGSIEFHVKSSDWDKHKHHLDKNYNNVILHLVAEANCTAKTENGRTIPNVIFPNIKQREKFFEQIFSNNSLIACYTYWNEKHKKILQFLLEQKLLERLDYKNKMVTHLLQQNNNHWEEVTYQLTSRYLGQKLNGDSFELLARKLPQSIIGKHKNNLSQIEALLFGQAGMLSTNNPQDFYHTLLQNEYLFLKQKYQLIPMEEHLWKYLRLRPANFPTLRIAQLAKILHNSSSIFSQILEMETIEDYQKLFASSVSDYWEYHYRFGKKSAKKYEHKIGKTIQNILIINVVVPILFCYGKQTKNSKMQSKAVKLLKRLPPEKNHITKNWEKMGINPQNASESQALIHLHENLCKPQLCNNCDISNQIIKDKFE